MSELTYTLGCRWCAATFTAGRKDARYCGPRCRQQACRQRGTRAAHFDRIAKGLAPRDLFFDLYVAGLIE